jgi:lipoprotein-releasing system ATP-binding protein
MSEFLEARRLCKTFAEGDRLIHVLRGLDLSLAAGERLAIVGQSGVGKSTLLHILGTLERPTSGEITFGGLNPLLLEDEQLAGFRNREIGFIFQFHYLLPDFTALENVMLPTLIQGWERERAEEAAARVLESVGLDDRLTHKPGKLSGGEQQRVAVARSVILEPRLILADEPTGDLDPRTGEEIQNLLFRLNEEKGIALIVATHNWAFAAAVGRRMELRDGRLSPL